MKRFYFLAGLASIMMLMLTGIAFAEEPAASEDSDDDSVKIYACPMHPEEISLDSEAKCSICDMALVEVEDLYACPMHCEGGILTTDSEAKCPKCGMALAEVEELYACTMHCDGKVYLDSEAKCEKCGMNVVMVNLDDDDGEDDDLYACPMHPDQTSTEE